MATEATALAKAYDLTVWMAERVARFPRTHHYTIGQRMVESLLDVQGLLIEAHYSKEKRVLVRVVSCHLPRRGVARKPRASLWGWSLAVRPEGA